MNLKLKSFAMLALISATLGLTSCDSTDVPAPDNEKSEELIPQEFLNITYDGETYLNVPTTYDEKGEFVFLDEDFSNIFESNLKGLTSLSIHLINDNSIEMYNDLDSNLYAHGISISEIPTDTDPSTRTDVSSEQNFLGTVDLYDDKNFKDTHWQFGIITATNPIWVDNLKSPYKFNDKCSSLILTNYLPSDSSQILNMGSYTLKYSEATLFFIGYDDTGYSDRTYTAWADPEEKKEYKELKNFNDKMSSFKLFFAKTGTYTTEGASK